MQGEKKGEQKMKHVLNTVPYYSQFLDVQDPEIKSRSCTITCLKMAMEYVLPEAEKVPSTDELFAESELIQRDMIERKVATRESAAYGRLHTTVVFLAHNHGCLAHMEEYKSMEVDLKAESFVRNEKYYDQMFYAGLERICKSLNDNSPVIVSVNRNLDKNGTPHSILIVGYEKDGDEVTGFYYNDPDSMDRENPLREKFVNVDDIFKHNWRRLSIFIDKLS